MKRLFLIILSALCIFAFIYIYISPNGHNSKDKIMFTNSSNGIDAWKKFSGAAAIDSSRSIIEADPLPTSSVYSFRDLKICLTQKRPGKGKYYGCDAWLKIMRDTNIVYEKSFLEIELEGAGLYVPRQQPLKDYFFIIKHGDYEGIQLIIDTTGVVREIPGGEYFITDNKKYMFVLQEIDGSAPFRVMDLSTMEFVFHSHKDEYGINSRYIDYYNIEFYKKNADIYARLIGDNGTKLYKYNFNKHILDGNVRQDTAKLSYIDLYYFYKNIGMCDCNENRF